MSLFRLLLMTSSCITFTLAFQEASTSTALCFVTIWKIHSSHDHHRYEVIVFFCSCLFFFSLCQMHFSWIIEIYIYLFYSFFFRFEIFSREIKTKERWAAACVCVYPVVTMTSRATRVVFLMKNVCVFVCLKLIKTIHQSHSLMPKNAPPY